MVSSGLQLVYINAAMGTRALAARTDRSVARMSTLQGDLRAQGYGVQLLSGGIVAPLDGATLILHLKRKVAHRPPRKPCGP